MLHSLHYSMLRRRLIWWIMKSYYNVLRLPSAFLALLLIGFARTFLIALRWWVVLGDTRSSWVPVQFGVPQGSVLGPLLYILFTDDISHLFAKVSASGPLYADDGQASPWSSFSIP